MAIVIKENNEEAGVAAEYAWIRQNFPGALPAGQALLGHGEKMYDLITVTLPDGTAREFYFDISGFFGRH